MARIFNYSAIFGGLISILFLTGLCQAVSLDHGELQPPFFELSMMTPTCVDCTVSFTVRKDKTDSPPSFYCWVIVGSSYDYWTGHCQRYQCSNGFYYTGPHWTTWAGCESSQVTPGTCPTGTCSPGE